ncbi:MAG: zf-HC2 domain-containing protein [Lachnospiraceae bacterium]|nr:zf-HC2 domain-containing protein [Candidatus Colinaster scatohippi]
MFGKNRSMDCKEFANLTPKWIEDELYGKEAYRFLEHMETCDECREELHIQFLVKEGMERLESGESFNLDEELLNKVDAYKKRLIHQHKMNVAVYWMEAVAIAAMIFIIALVVILKF